MSAVGWQGQGPAWGLSPMNAFLLQAMDSVGLALTWHSTHVAPNRSTRTFWHAFLPWYLSIHRRAPALLLADQGEFHVWLPFRSWCWCEHKPHPFFLGAQRKQLRRRRTFPKTFPWAQPQETSAQNSDGHRPGLRAQGPCPAPAVCWDPGRETPKDMTAYLPHETGSASRSVPGASLPTFQCSPASDV